MSRTELQLPSSVPLTVLAATVNKAAGANVMAWSTGGAPTHTIVPPLRVAK